MVSFLSSLGNHHIKHFVIHRLPWRLNLQWRVCRLHLSISKTNWQHVSHGLRGIPRVFWNRYQGNCLSDCSVFLSLSGFTRLPIAFVMINKNSLSWCSKIYQFFSFVCILIFQDFCRLWYDKVYFLKFFWILPFVLYL